MGLLTKPRQDDEDAIIPDPITSDVQAEIGGGMSLGHRGAPGGGHRGNAEHQQRDRAGLELKGGTHLHHAGMAAVELRGDTQVHHAGSTGLEVKGGAHVHHDGRAGVDLGGATTLGLAGAAEVQLGNGAGRPLAAAVQLQVGGGAEPLRIGPLSIDLGQLQLRPDLEVRFRLFGRFTLFSLSLRGRTRVGPGTE